MNYPKPKQLKLLALGSHAVPKYICVPGYAPSNFIINRPKAKVRLLGLPETLPLIDQDYDPFAIGDWDEEVLGPRRRTQNTVFGKFNHLCILMCLVVCLPLLFYFLNRYLRKK